MLQFLVAFLAYLSLFFVGLADPAQAAAAGQAAAPARAPARPAWPKLIPLTRESVPVTRNNVTLAHKTSYSGTISIGTPAQDFHVVFDTGSGHIVLPSSTCKAETCLMHNRYDLKRSYTAAPINVNGDRVPAGELCDQVTIGYGTGKVTGEFARDRVCLGGDQEACLKVSVVMAVEMTAQPFKSFNFDGIFGLALSALAVAPEFSFFNRLSEHLGGSALGVALQFGVYLSGEGGTAGSELALGGYNEERLLTPIRWAPVAKKEMGYWQVDIREVRVGNRTLDMCKDGSCRGVVDTGTSHLGIPQQHLGEITALTTVNGVSEVDCRFVEAPPIELVLASGVRLKLSAENYMRPLSLPAGVKVGSKNGVTTNETAHVEKEDAHDSDTASLVALRGSQGNGSRSCSPRLMSVNLPAPLGPNLFILGEPVLHRYYTVYDWRETRVGFGLARNEQNTRALETGEAADFEDPGEEEEEIYSFMQVTLTLSVRSSPCVEELEELPATSAWL